MNAPARTTAEETRARIIETAEALFRRLGFAKTAVADIAGELGMSPANVYRFFPSKHAIVEAICVRCLGELDETVWAVARSRGSAANRLDRLFHGVLRYHRDNFVEEKRVHDIVLIAIDEDWDAIMAHKETVRTTVELILRDGIDNGEFEAVDPKETSRLLMRAMVGFCHPVLVAKGMAEDIDLMAESSATLQLILQGIIKRT
ncbi:MAG: TetR family transcriptional regulator [Bauldia sp.]|uniref:TetR/AcrR family transcriptional regulator n=1 Tax=Bauldia sp. TaxID=2575872 RepID=UPI001DDFA23B|nr:TetR/AcrR family transcriptional regulator [Bauldia sp.]MCB1495493.1 TetR family transcriptional regulator [Bauldia sp.]